MTKRAQKYDCLTGRIRAIVFCTIGITLLFGWADAYNALATNYLQQNLRENSLNASVKGNKSPLGSLLSFSSLMLSQNLSQESKSPVSSVHISHITSVPPAGERQAFFELAVSSLKFEVWSCPVISSGPRPEGEGSREILSCRASRRNSRNKGNPRHFERSEAESRNPFMQKHREERKISHRLHRFSQNFQSDDKLCSQASGLHGAAERRQPTAAGETRRRQTTTRGVSPSE